MDGRDVGLRTRLEGDLCVYCGERATCWDHFPPYSCDALKGWLLPACLECNGIAGDRHPYDFEARAAYVNRALIRRYRWITESRAWTDAELRELGRGLRDTIEPLAHARSIAWARVKWNAVAYLATLGLGLRFQPVAILPPWRKPVVVEPWRVPVLIEYKPGRKRWRGPHWVDRTRYHPVEAKPRMSREPSSDLLAFIAERESDRLTRRDMATLEAALFEAILLVIVAALPE